jgi:hypothetical protein
MFRFLSSSGELFLSHCVIEYGRANGSGDERRGGGVYIASAEPVTIENTRISGCSAPVSGGAIHYGNPGALLRLSGCTIADNFTTNEGNGGDGGPGGGIYAAGPLHLLNCLVRDNHTGRGKTTPREDSRRYHGGNGGGIYSSAVCTLITSIVTGNTTGNGGPNANSIGSGNDGGDGGRGGGVYADAGLLIEGGEIGNNATGHGGEALEGGSGGHGGHGGGVFCPAQTIIRNATVTGNSSGNGGASGRALTKTGGDGGNGGGIFSDLLTMDSCLVTANRTGGGGACSQSPGHGGHGGGVFARKGILIDRSTFTSNETGGGGADRYSDDAGEGGYGAGVYYTRTTESEGVQIRNSLFAWNRCGHLVSSSDRGPGGRGGAIGANFIWDSTPETHASERIINCTIVGNYAPLYGGGIAGGFAVINGIVWGNRQHYAASQSVHDERQVFGIDTMVFSCIQDGFPPGIGNTTSDPGFADSADGDFSLSGRSHCIDAGTPDTTGLAVGSSDIDGRERIRQGGYTRIDMGAYEYPQAVETIVAAGPIVEDRTWDTDTVVILGDIVIDTGVTLTIAPGTIVTVDGHRAIRVHGTLHAAGTVTDSIVFTSVDTTGFSDTLGAEGAWRGIRFSDTDFDADSSIISYCRLEYAKTFGSDTDSCGGAILVDSFPKVRVSESLIRRCAAGNGGAIACVNGANPLVRGCTIEECLARAGGGLYAAVASPVVLTTIFRHNRAVNGGAYCLLRGDAAFVNNLVYRNTALANGGGIYINDNAVIRITNATVSANTAASGEAIYGSIGCRVTAVNTILWQASDPAKLLKFSLGCTDSLAHCLVEGGAGGVAIDDSYPMFIDTSYDTWAIFGSSSAVDAGSDQAPHLALVETDIAGNPRTHHGAVDIGAYEQNLDPPAPATPADGAEVTATAIELVWHTVAGATSYRLRLSSDSLFRTIATEMTIEDDTSASVGTLATEESYYWRVTSSDGTYRSPPSTVWSFTAVESVLPEVSIVGPSHREIIANESATLSWRSADAPVGGYDVEVASDSLFGDMVDQHQVTDTFVVITGLQTLTPYWWRVRASDGSGGVGVWTQPRRFELDESSRVHHARHFDAGTWHLSPAMGRLSYTLPEATRVRLAIYDTRGALVHLAIDKLQKAGTHSVRVNNGALAQGRYISVLTAYGNDIRQSFALVR